MTRRVLRGGREAASDGAVSRVSLCLFFLKKIRKKDRKESIVPESGVSPPVISWDPPVS